MALIVQKFGGTSVADPQKMKFVADRIVETKRAGHQVVVVVSAPGDTTDRLIEMAGEITDTPDQRELDVLLATGEQQSIALLAMAIIAKGCKAVSLTGAQVEIRTDDVHTRARIMDINAHRVKKILKSGKVAVVAGFQGVNSREDVTTLGRGGSDLTAVALAAALRADICEFYKDVDGIFTANPRMVPEARKLDRISYEEMLEMASAGAEVLNARSVLFAKNYGIPLHIRPTFKKKGGTMITKETKGMERVVISGITYNLDEAKITVRGVPDRPGIAAKLFSKLGESNVNVDMIIQNVGEGGLSDISFTVPRTELKRSYALVQDVARQLQAAGVFCDDRIAKVSVIGVGMRSHSGVAGKMFRALAEKKVNIQMISTSEIKVSVVVEASQTKKAVQALHRAFQLGKKSSREKLK